MTSNPFSPTEEELKAMVEQINREFALEFLKHSRDHQAFKYGTPEFAAASARAAETCKTVEMILRTPG